MAPRQSLVLAGHGSQYHPQAAAPLHDHADRIRSRGLFDDVRTVFWKESPALHDARAVATGEAVYVVPVLTSEGYFADEVFPRELGEGEKSLHYTAPVGTHDAMRDVIQDRIESTATGPLADIGVALVGHGTERNEQSARATKAHARRLRADGSVAEVVSLFLDESPHIGQLLERISTDEVVVVPLFVADGYHTTTDIPQAIGHPGIGETAELDGRLVHLTGAVGTEPRVAEVIVERAIEAGARIGRGSSAELSDPAQAFLASLEPPYEWGELVVGRSASGYSIRHRADTGEAELTSIADASALRQHVRHDDSGQYRPLSSAESLPTGWVLAGLSRQELIQAVRAVYPGSITLWHRDRTGRLEPSCFDETAARQSGLYAEVATLDSRERAAVTESVCGSCVRERRWSIHETETPDKDCEETAIPCREACPFLLSAAHVVSDLEPADEPDSVAPEVAPGQLAEPGNRYRVRYSRVRSRQRPVQQGEL